MSKANKSKKNKINWGKVSLVTKTVLVCAIIAGAVIYHILSLQVATKKAYLEGASDFKRIEQAK